MMVKAHTGAKASTSREIQLAPPSHGSDQSFLADDKNGGDNSPDLIWIRVTSPSGLVSLNLNLPSVPEGGLGGSVVYCGNIG